MLRQDQPDLVECVACGQPLPAGHRHADDEVEPVVARDGHGAMLIDLCRRGEEAQVRALLVELCRGGRVRQDDWSKRDSSDNQRQLAECGALLEAGCRFDVDLDLSSIECYSIDVFFRGWDWPDDHEEAADGFIIPTAERLAELGGKDWSP